MEHFKVINFHWHRDNEERRGKRGSIESWHSDLLIMITKPSQCLPFFFFLFCLRNAPLLWSVSKEIKWTATTRYWRFAHKKSHAIEIHGIPHSPNNVTFLKFVRLSTQARERESEKDGGIMAGRQRSEWRKIILPLINYDHLRYHTSVGYERAGFSGRENYEKTSQFKREMQRFFVVVTWQKNHIEFIEKGWNYKK